MIVLTILITILKWLGIVILSLIGLLLLLLFIVLFIPIRYKLKASYNQDGVINIKINWFLHILRFNIDYSSKENKLEYFLKVLFIDLLKIKASQKKRKDGNIEISSVKQKSNDMQITNNNLTVISDKNNNKEANEMSHDENSIEEIKEDNSKNFSEKLCSFFNRIKAIYNKICNFLSKAKEKVEHKKYTINKLYDKIIAMIDKITNIKNHLTSNKSKKAFGFIINQIKIIFKHIGPKVWDLNMVYGFENIANTGKVLGIIAYIYPKFPGKLNVVPDFENSHFEADTLIKGHIRIISVLIPAVKVYMNKDVKYTFNKLKKLK